MPRLKELVGSKSKGVLHNMQKAVLLGTLTITRTLKVETKKNEYRIRIYYLSSLNIFRTFKVMKQSSMNFYSRISGMFERTFFFFKKKEYY